MANSAFEQKQTGNASTTAAGSVEIATPAQVAARTAVGETGATLAVSPADLPQTSVVDIDFTAGHNITTGALVAISDMIDTPTVGIARASALTAAHGIGATIGNALVGQDTTTNVDIGSGKIGRIIHNGTNIYVQVVQTNRSTKSITCGTAQSCIATGAAFYAVAKLDTDKFIAFYNDAGAVNDIKYRVCNVSGTTITLGAQGTFYTAASTLATGRIYAEQLDTNKGVVFMKAATTTSSKVIAFTVSGDTATAGTAANPDTDQQANNAGGVKKIGTDKFVLATSNSGYVRFQACTVSGTTITTGTGVQLTIAATTSSTYFGVDSPATDVFVCRYNKTGQTTSLVAGTVSGTTITLGTPIDQGALNGVGFVTAMSATKIWWSSPLSIAEVTLSGTTLTHSRYVYYATTAAPTGIDSSNKVLLLSSGYWVWFSTNWDTTNHEFFIQGMGGRAFIGVAQDTVNMGETVTVRVAGIAGGQSGISPGCYYTVDNGVLTQTSNDVTTADSYAEQDRVVGVSETQILVIK